ncbi:AEC family transporter [Mycoplasma sp. Mirounga ES2805-ORL]|uniref:AEC family transporter n=1 Tax=Mycoplasma sp. Mirounga ES2805-ORL TaxID=754514 RepID=UPI00197BCD3F|nr:malate permease [Mycoplasma sp. Mirounga ES2805-ORL]QSF13683.1 malate permease [Mycoplasma sp. Mirounga ES2805-ORL]
MKEVLISTLNNTSLWGVIIASVFVISIGFILMKTNIFKKEWLPGFTSVIMNVSLPAIAVKGFMSDINMGKLKEQAWILLISFIFYFVLSLVAYLWMKFFYRKVPKSVENANEETIIGALSGTDEKDSPRDKALVMWMLLIFGSTITFGMPIADEFYKNTPSHDTALVSVNVFNIMQRVFCYTYCFMMIKGIRLNKQNVKKSLRSIALNPALIGTFVGLGLWLSQLIPGLGASSIPADIKFNLDPKTSIQLVSKAKFGTNMQPIFFDADNNKYIFNSAINNYQLTEINPTGWFDFKITLPYFYKIAAVLSELCTPLIWLTIGMKISESKLKSLFADKQAWLYSFLKLIVIQLIIFGSLFLLNYYGKITKVSAISIMIITATPPGAAPMAFVLNEKRASHFAVRASTLSTLLSLFIIPFWIIISEIVYI